MSRIRLAGVLLAALLPACAGMPTQVNLRLRTDKVLNKAEDASGSSVSAPIAVRLFRLTSREKFEGASFDQLFADPKAALGETLSGDVIDIDLGVDRNWTYPLPLSPGVQFVGVMGLFTKYEQESWRVLCPVTEAEAKEFFFSNYSVERRSQ